jgi:signal transduction histidine kinase
LQLELQAEKEKKQNQLLQSALESHEIERNRISSELHDDIGALLSTIKLYLNQIQPENLNDEGKIKALNDCKELINDTVQTVRNLSTNLQPSIIKDFGLLSTLQNYCDKLKDASGLQISVKAQGVIDRFQSEHELAAFRILQELTNNIIKHADADNIQFSLLRKNNDTLKIFIEYNGDGLSQKEFEQKLYSKQGLGLKSIQNRLNILKGNIHFEKNSNLMNTISLQLPIITIPQL